ncbi:MAG: hypothetical protein LBS55_03420 [Prevotellaceae bacterium]|jgi:uncharacterized membrane protein|nr:hypothetical protein [Prevotellaceae bacterium]
MKKGTSNVPMIMGIIGGVLGFPAAICAGFCSETLTDDTSVGSFYLWFGILGAIIGLVGGLLGKKMPVPAGAIMIGAAVITGITMIIGNMLAAVVAILFVLGGIFCFVQQKTVV